MRAVVCTHLGDPTLPLGAGPLCIKEHSPVTIVDKGHVRIRVKAASLNFPDALQVQGKYQVKPPLPFVPGSEVSGTIVELGPGVEKFKLGDRVCAISQNGAFVEDVVVHENMAWGVPDGIELEVACCVPVVYGTSQLALAHRAQLKKGQVLLVLGAGGGVGVAACQIGKIMGAKVIAVVNGKEKVEFLQTLGVDHVFDASQYSPAAQPLHQAIKATVRQGVDVVFDPVGGSLFEEALKCTAPWGAHYLVIGFASGGIPKVPANLALVKNLTVHGVFWGSYLQNEPKVLMKGMNTVLSWLAEGKIELKVSHRFLMEDVDKAFKAVLGRKVMGKAILVMETQSRL
ncbi:hypothetical protein CEUSTIGMA_g126.t1 [Chlamydomonas eustigma]|uniref:Enoyl reductase (ER) domain-containing protein n=1 Tax=Chlamydomonas eustigma TaxID=1157962 RepID=A0A250WQ46_9CHLO|nr:hypothetical protein CEUSTIGMA_g126.t1 [Chlamydomonas eustigma]|eukprot:GAX72670.1 hypothetical protein CEUSTIGMA_g126.t1 [Chlamydomonas eustigma]